MINARVENGRLVLRTDTAESAALLGNLQSVIKRKAKPYFRRGYRSVTQGRKIRTYEDVRNIIYAHNKALGAEDSVWLWYYVQTMAASYCAGVKAAQAELAG